MAYPLRFPEKAPKGTKQGAKLPEVLIQGREIGVFLAFPRFLSVVKRIEQDLRRRALYPGELRRHAHIFYPISFRVSRKYSTFFGLLRIYYHGYG